MNAETNPYATPEGGPLPDKFAEWMEWTDLERQKHLDSLPPEERAKAIKIQKQREDRLLSQVSVTLVNPK